MKKVLYRIDPSELQFDKMTRRDAAAVYKLLTWTDRLNRWFGFLGKPEHELHPMTITVKDGKITYRRKEFRWQE